MSILSSSERTRVYASARRRLLRCLLMTMPVAGSAIAQTSAVSRASGTPLSQAPVSPPQSALPPDLSALVQPAFRQGWPLVLMYSLHGCPWCDALRREHFNALERRQVEEGVLVIELDMQDQRPFASYENEPARPGTTLQPRWMAPSARELARQQRIRLAPTLVFLGPDGEVADRLVGYGSPDFFGAYLEQRIGQAKAALAKR